jgi:hypothetical protein
MDKENLKVYLEKCARLSFSGEDFKRLGRVGFNYKIPKKLISRMRGRTTTPVETPLKPMYFKEGPNMVQVNLSNPTPKSKQITKPEEFSDFLGNIIGNKDMFDERNI